MNFLKAEKKAKKLSLTSGEPCGVFQKGDGYVTGSWEYALKNDQVPDVWFESGNLSGFDEEVLEQGT